MKMLSGKCHEKVPYIIMLMLKNLNLFRDLHHHWSGLVISCLPFLGTALTQVKTFLQIFITFRIWSFSSTLICI